MTDLQGKARRHLWMHFSQLAALQRDDMPIIMLIIPAGATHRTLNTNLPFK